MPQKKWVTRASATVDATLVCDGVYFGPLCGVIHGDQEISVSPLALREWPSNVDCNPLESSPDVILVHQATISGSLTSAGVTDVTLLTPTFFVAL